MRTGVAILVAALFAVPPSRAADLVDSLAAITVKVRAYKGSTLLKDSSGLVREDFEYGTGFVIEDAIIVTAKHTVVFPEGASHSVQCWSAAKGRYDGCAVISVSPDRDIAFLWYPAAAGKRLRVRDDGREPRGTLFAVGYPDTPYAKPRIMISTGDLLDWTTSAPGAGHVSERRNLAAANLLAFPGCSGAPIVTRDLELVGMIVSILENDEGEWNGASYFVKAADIAAALEAARRAIAQKKGYEFLRPR